jgi:hypothetical protein
VVCEIVNLAQPAIAYAHFFSYSTPDVMSQNLEVSGPLPKRLRACAAIQSVL